MNPVGWFEIYVNDMSRASKFYEAILGKPLTKMDAPIKELAMMAFPGGQGSPGATGALVKMEGMKAGGSSTIVYFVSDDCAQVAARVEPAGGKVVKPKFPIGQYGFIILATDTEGNMFGVHSMK